MPTVRTDTAVKVRNRARNMRLYFIYRIKNFVVAHLLRRSVKKRKCDQGLLKNYIVFHISPLHFGGCRKFIAEAQVSKISVNE